MVYVDSIFCDKSSIFKVYGQEITEKMNTWESCIEDYYKDVTCNRRDEEKGQNINNIGIEC